MRSSSARLILAALVFGVASTAASAKYPEPKNPWPEFGVETQLYIGASFMGALGNNSAVRTFEADGDRGLWLQDNKRRWYYAEILGTCNGLNFAQAIGFDNRGSSYLDKFTRILVRGDSCAVASFVTADRPPTRAERKAALQEKRAATKAAKAAKTAR
jgi:hypothetical protein